MNPQEVKNISFKSRENMYSSIIEEYEGTFGLLDTIDSKEYKNQQVHYYIRIRLFNGNIALYETHGLKRWLDQNSTDPITRENILFQKPRVIAKLSWMQKFNTMVNSDITPTFKKNILKAYINDPIKNKEAARAFVDISTFYDCGYVHKDLTVYNTKEVAKDGWLLRVSSKHNSKELKKNTQVVVFSTGKIQKRLVEVDGMGFIYYNGNNISEPLEYKNIVYPCLIDAIIAKLGIIQFNSIVIPKIIENNNNNKII